MKAKTFIVIAAIVLAGCATYTYTEEAAHTDLERGNYPAAFKEYSNLASAGDLQAQTMLGYMYETGLGTRNADLNQAAYWYTKAAVQGDMAAAAFLGNQLLWEMEAYGGAYTWNAKAAEGGDVLAEANLAYQYKQGLGIAQNDDKAAMWLHKAMLDAPGDIPHFQFTVKAMISEQRYYPDSSVAAGRTGVAVIGFDYYGDSKATNVKVIQSSGDYVLDESAVNSVKNAMLPRIPNALQSAGVHNFRVALNFIGITKFPNP